MEVEHDFNSKLEQKEVMKWIDKELGLEHETTWGENGKGTIMIYGLLHKEFDCLMKFLKENKWA